MTLPERLQALAPSLGRLAAEAPAQIDYLTGLGVADCADELALEFDDRYLPNVTKLAELSPEAAAACRELDRLVSGERLAGGSPTSSR